jgi:hypothetical protein
MLHASGLFYFREVEQFGIELDYNGNCDYQNIKRSKHLN